MMLNGFCADAKTLGNLSRWESHRDELENLLLAPGEPGQAARLDRTRDPNPGQTLRAGSMGAGLGPPQTSPPCTLPRKPPATLVLETEWLHSQDWPFLLTLGERG